MKKELRFLDGAEVRAGSGRKISGYAATFDSPTTIIDFEETIRPGAFSRALRERQDVRALWNHDPSRILGRTASGTLRLSEDSRGLHFEVELPNSPTGSDVLESIRRGDVTGASFGFMARRDRWNASRTERELLDLDLFDISPVTYPAYQSTSVSARSGGDGPSTIGTYQFRRTNGSSIYRREEPVDQEVEDLRRRAKLALLQEQLRGGI